MKLSSLNIIKLLQLKGVGRAKIFKIDKSCPFNPNSNIEFADLLYEIGSELKISELSKSEIYKSFDVGEELYEKSKEKGIKIIRFGDVLYPKALEVISNPPILLNVLGNIEDLSEKPGVAVIGTRQPTNYGRQIGERIGFRLGESGINVVSGLAIGCDTAGHRGCLDAKGYTTAILAHGLDTVYPKENKILADEILQNGGCLISEYLIKTKSLPNYFVERDRIQAGLSEATFVIETDVKGGTMHAVNATIANKRILAVYDHPLDKQSDKSRGNQFLIRERKAIGVKSKDDIEKFIQKIIPNYIINVAIPFKQETNFADNINEFDITELPDSFFSDFAHEDFNHEQLEEPSEEKFTLTPPPTKNPKVKKQVKEKKGPKANKEKKLKGETKAKKDLKHKKKNQNLSLKLID